MECAFTSPLMTECDMFEMYCMQCCFRFSCFVVRGCAVSRRYINVCNYEMFSVVNVYLMSVMSPPPALCNLLSRTVVKLCTLGVCFRGELGFLNCDDICICVVDKQFELLEFLIPFMLICSMMRFLSLLLLGLWSSLVCL